ncbi:MAG TPA: MATE family efflux transporter [Euryarchaeota archaeon]|nr:MATE family efflux transporter [Euryarchaeota archaeon]
MKNIGLEARREEILKGPILKTLIKLASPSIGIYAFSSMYYLMDTIWLGGLGSSSVSAPTFTWPIINTLFSLVLGISMASVALVTQYRGAKMDDEARYSIGQTFIVASIISIPLVIVFLYILPLISNFFGLEGSFREDFINYAQLVVFSDIAYGFAYISSIVIRNWGYPEISFLVAFPYVLLNVILDPLLIYGFFGFPAMGVKGAALATLISQSLQTFTSLYVMRSEKYIGLKLHHFKPRKDLIKKLIKVGTPLSGSNAITASGFFVLTAIISRIGPYAITAWTIYNRVSEIGTWFAYALNDAATTMTGQSIGNNNFERAKKVAKLNVTVNFIVILITSILIAIFSKELFGFFLRNPEDPYRDVVVFEESVLISWTFGMSIPFFILSVSALTPFTASGNTKYNLLVAIMRLWGLRVPLSYIFGISLEMGSLGAWVGMAISNVIAGLLAYILMMKNLWVMRVIE